MKCIIRLRNVFLVSSTALLSVLFINGMSPSCLAAEDVSKGQKLLEKNGCLHCHYIRGQGGLIGPPFEGINKYRTEDNIVALLTKRRPLPPFYPRGVFDPREFMRHVQLDKKTAQEIAAYIIKTPPEDSFEVRKHDGDEDQPAKADLPQGFTFKPSATSDASRKGMLLYKDKGCAACHSIAGTGGHRGPALDGVGATMGRNAIENRVARGAVVMFDDKEYRPTQYVMPPAELTADQIKQITEFLMTLPTKDSNK